MTYRLRKRPRRLEAVTGLFYGLRHLWLATDRTARKLAAITIAIALASSAIATAAPLFLKHLIDALSAEATPDVSTALIGLLAAYVSAQWLVRTFSEFQDSLMGKVDQRMQRQLSDRFFQHVIRVPFNYHLSQQAGALTQTLTNGLVGLRIVLQHFVHSSLPLVVQFCGIAAVLVLLGHPAFLGIISLSVIFYCLAFWIGGIRIHAPAKEVSSAHIRAGAVFTDTLLNMETVKCFQGERKVARMYDSLLRNAERCWSRLYTRKMESGLLVAGIFSISLGVSLYAGVRAVTTDTMSIGDFVLLNAYVLQLARPVELMGAAFRDVAQAAAFIENMATVMDEIPEPVLPTPTGKQFPGGDFRFNDVSLRYERSAPVLHGMNCVIPEGSTVAVVGSSGSGKSSLARLFVRLVEPTGGCISIGHTPLAEISLSSLRDAIAVVPQEAILFDASIEFNIGFGNRQGTREELIDAAKAAGIHDFIASLPGGYGTRVGERGLKLSGGERQRIAIARAVFKKPKVFIFDEATSSLDTRSESDILARLAGITAGRTAIVITHRLAVAARADTIIVIDNGRVVESGSHRALIDRAGHYATLWSIQETSIVRRKASAG